MIELLKKLAEIQGKLNSPKSQFNNFGKYSYRNCEDILQAVKPLLDESVILVSDQIEQVGDRFYVKATATFYFGDNSISVSAYARESLDKKGMDTAQVTGSTSSYARKYALNGLLLIDDNKDADSQDNSAKSTTYLAKYVVNELDQQWIDAYKADPSVLNQLDDKDYIEMIKREAAK